MGKRNLRWPGDKLLDAAEHPKDTRLLLSRRSDPPQPFEVTIAEWAPSGKRVKLRPLMGMAYWCECWDYEPVVIEVLP